MTRLEDRQTLTSTIAQARAGGARLSSACALAGLDVRTLQRWQRGGDPVTPGQVRADRRPDAIRPSPSHALSEAERARIVAVAMAHSAVLRSRGVAKWNSRSSSFNRSSAARAFCSLGSRRANLEGSKAQ